MTDTAMLENVIVTDAPRKRRRYRARKPLLKTLSELDQRTKVAMRARGLIEAIEADHGGDLTIGQKQLAMHIAILGAMIEDNAARWLSGEQIDQANFALLVNAQRRCLQAL